MAVVLAIVLMIIVSILSIGSLGVALYLYTRKFAEPETGSILLMFDNRHSDGHVIGTIVKYDRGRNNRAIIDYVPKDLSVEEAKRKEINRIITPESHVYTFPKGSWSKSREIVFILPFRTDDVSVRFDDPKFKSLFALVSQRSSDNTMIEALTEQIERMNIFARQVAGGEWTREEVNKFLNMFAALTEAAAKGKEKPIYGRVEGV